ncbi:MAG: cupin domain-containing protein [Bacillota bacterium]
MNNQARELIDHFNMQILPQEGGYFTEYFDSDLLLPQTWFGDRYNGDRKLYGFSYYLMTDETFSNWHRLKSDEFWQWSAGDVAEQLQLFPDGSLKRILLGGDYKNGESFVALVPKDVWQSTRLISGGQYALYGVTTAPRFNYDDWEHATVEQLVEEFSQHKDVLLRNQR